MYGQYSRAGYNGARTVMKLVCNIKNSQTIMKETYVVMHLPTLMCNGIHNKIVGTKK